MAEITCVGCGITGPMRNDEEWNQKTMAEEFLTLTPECKNDATDIVCDACFQVYKVWLSQQTEDDKRKMRDDG
jgi:hypothetical protein